MSDCVERWLQSGKAAQVNGLLLSPVPHKLLRHTPVRIRRGQADVYPLVANTGRRYMLKKFLAGRGLDYSYLTKVRDVLPRAAGFAAGNERDVLTSGVLCYSTDSYHHPSLAAWLHKTVLMPRLRSSDWSVVADELRAGQRHLSRQDRVTLATSLAGLVHQLECHDCGHRDLTGANVFVDLQTRAVELIDFDSLYHASVPLPAGTTCGTPGYMAPFACVGRDDPRATWCARADRFALALICVEFLVVGRGAPSCGDGGLFEQQHITRRRGPSIAWARGQLMARFSEFVPLFDQALASTSFKHCPAPRHWETALDFWSSSNGGVPQLRDIPAPAVPDPRRFVRVVPLPPAPPGQMQPHLTFKENSVSPSDGSRGHERPLPLALVAVQARTPQKTPDTRSDQMPARLIRIIFSDGLIVGFARLMLGLVYLAAVGAASRNGPAVLVVAMALTCALLICLGAFWHGIVTALFAPDWPLWHPMNGLSRSRRWGLAACYHVIFGLFVAMFTAALMPHPALLLPLPITASILQRLCGWLRSGRPVDQLEETRTDTDGRSSLARTEPGGGSAGASSDSTVSGER